MIAATPATTTTSPSRRVACWLLAVALLLQAIWLPFHLATEQHLVPGCGAPGCGDGWLAGTSGVDGVALEVAAPHADEPESPPHSVLDHQDQKQLRHDEHDDGPLPSVAGDDDDARGDDAPLLWLATAALQLPIGRAPPQFADDVRSQIRSPLLAAAEPRAPPQG